MVWSDLKLNNTRSSHRPIAYVVIGWFNENSNEKFVESTHFFCVGIQFQMCQCNLNPYHVIPSNRILFSFHIKLITPPLVRILNINFEHFAQRLTEISLYSHGIAVVVVFFFCFWKMALLSLGGALRSPVTVCNNSYWFSCYCFVISQYKHITRGSIELNEKETEKK